MNHPIDLSAISTIDFLKARHGEEFAGFQALFTLPAKRTFSFGSQQWNELALEIEKQKDSADLYPVLFTGA